jgi:hypothetical protein
MNPRRHRPSLITNLVTNQRRTLFPPSLRSFIVTLESKVFVDLVEPQDENHIIIKGCPSIGTQEGEKAQWKKAIEDHKW